MLAKRAVLPIDFRAMAMFANLGRTLSLLRELRGKSQARVAREAGIGKSQLSKYENGKELPKLDSLEKVLIALKVGYFEFFYTLYLVDRRAADLGAGEEKEEPGRARASRSICRPWTATPFSPKARTRHSARSLRTCCSSIAGSSSRWFSRGSTGPRTATGRQAELMGP